MKMALMRRVGRVVVLVHPSGAMPDDDWNRIQTDLAAMGPATDDERMVVWAEGSINANQRKAAKEMNGGGKERKVVMFTDSMVTRGVMQALAWMGMKIRAFSKADVDKGLAAEGLDKDEAAAVKVAIVEMERELAAQR